MQSWNKNLKRLRSMQTSSKAKKIINIRESAASLRLMKTGIKAVPIKLKAQKFSDGKLLQDLTLSVPPAASSRSSPSLLTLISTLRSSQAGYSLMIRWLMMTIERLQGSASWPSVAANQALTQKRKMVATALSAQWTRLLWKKLHLVVSWGQMTTTRSSSNRRNSYRSRPISKM